MVINQNVRNIKLTLSQACYRRLSSDSDIFGITKSHLIETIICEFCLSAGQLSKLQKNAKPKTIYEIISDGGEILFFRTVLRLLAGTEHRHFYTETEIYNWTITSKARTALTNDSLSDSESYNFISEILEEYSVMNYASREQIILRDKIANIKKAIDNSLEISYSTRGGRINRILPYKIITESDSQYNYLIGQFINENDTDKIACARIFSMNNISLFKTKHKIDGSAIEHYISGRNIAYLWGEETNIEVGLTEKGEQTFCLLFNNRPNCIDKSDNYVNGFRIYRFRCTEFQAEIYFRNFGNNAKVIYPVSLAEKIKNFHIEAAKMYSE